MSSGSLANGAFVTTVEGRRCTAVPKPGSNAANAKAENNGNNNNDNNDNNNNNNNDNNNDNNNNDNNNGNTAAAAETAAAFSTTSKTSQSTTSTSQIITTSTTSSTTSSTSLALIQTSSSTEDVALQAELSRPPEILPPVASTTIPTILETDPSQTSQALQPPPQTQTAIPSALQTSKADTSITAAPEATSQPSVQQISDVNGSPTATAGANPLFTTIGTAPSEQATDGSTSTTNGAINAVPSSNGPSVQSTVAVAGGVIGGVVALSTIAFFIWWWRRRMVKRRRSTLLTPLTVDNLGRPTGGGEKGAYEINRSSIGPTPVTEKVKNAIGYNVKKIRGRMSRIVTRGGSTSSPSVNMNRGNSQFMDPVSSSHSRATSSTLSSGSGAEVTSKDRFLDWWSRLTADVNFNWGLKNKGSNEQFSSSSRAMNEKKPAANGQPDFLTLLGMDERELDREAQRRRASVARKAGSAGSADHFLGGLNLSFGGSNSNPDDPFSDANALPRSSAKPAPLVVSQANNPFSDSNAIRNQAPPKPNTYVADIRRSRNQSISGGAGNNWPSAAAPGGYRESVASVESYTTRRNNKFRSDPFDLERPELLASARQAKASMSSSTAGTAGSSDWPPRASRLSGGVGTGDIRRPPGAHQRSESFSSKYSSGVSMGDWSDPGPDVGPAASRKDGSEARQSPTEAWRNRLEREAAAKAKLKRSPSASSDRSVGKAM